MYLLIYNILFYMHLYYSSNLLYKRDLYSHFIFQFAREKKEKVLGNQLQNKLVLNLEFQLKPNNCFDDD